MGVSRIGGKLVAATLAALVAAALLVPTAAARESGGSGSWAAFLHDREKLLQTLAPAFVDCFQRRDSAVDPLSPIFHGCLDWHSAVHAAYSHHVLYRRTGKQKYLDLVQNQIEPQGVPLAPAEQAYEVAKSPNYPLTENPYGFGWFLILERERELATKKNDLAPMADFAADQMMAWFSDRAAQGDAQTYILDRTHPNYSWSLINLDVWARYRKDKAILAAVKGAAKPLLEKDLDGLCPITMDTTDKAQGFQPACLMRLAAVAHVFGADERDWVESRLPKKLHIDPVKDPANCHAGGLNFTRAFALYQLYLLTGDSNYRDNYAELIRYHVSRPDLFMGHDYLGNPDYLCYSHWVAQMGVRAISLSYGE